MYLKRVNSIKKLYEKKVSDQSEIWNCISWLKKVSKVLQKMIDLPRLFTLEKLCARVERKIRATWIYICIYEKKYLATTFVYQSEIWNCISWPKKGSKALQKMIDLPRLFTLEKLCACVERNIYIHIWKEISSHNCNKKLLHGHRTISEKSHHKLRRDCSAGRRILETKIKHIQKK